MTLTNNHPGDGEDANVAFYESLAKLSPEDQAHVIVHFGIGAEILASEAKEGQSGSVEVKESGEITLVQK